jgi:predicted helicase
MSRPTKLTPKHRLIAEYYDALRRFREQGVGHESATRSAFQNLLAGAANLVGWTLIPELGAHESHGRRVIPDGTLRDSSFLPRGYWEAKDSADNLEAEVRKKVDKGYPLSNTIFEDTSRAILYQNGNQIFSVDLSDARQLSDLLSQFLGYIEPDIRGFEEAVEEFKLRVPELARGLAAKLNEAHETNRYFKDAFAAFFALCRESLDPRITRETVDEMLVQHLLTERLMRTILDNPDFSNKNVIAAEVEKVIEALSRQSFSRTELLRNLDRFYIAIENAARRLPDFSEKQHFLNTVYERFFKGYSVKVADTHGIVYTPQAIVDFMCASVEHILQTEFGRSLGDTDINLLDPCTGTGNFVVNILHRVPRKSLYRVYTEQLFANEVMLLPYYIAALNVEHAYTELAQTYEPFEGLCFVDTLDDGKQIRLFAEENTRRVLKQRDKSITVILGNPPYNVGQDDENDRNRNRKYPAVGNRIRETYVKDSAATLVMQVYDPYVRFFRWASDRLESRAGLVCFISNNSFIDQQPFDGMRMHLFHDFQRIYHVDLHGNVRRNPKLSGTVHNVFGIQTGVGITLALKKAGVSVPEVHYCRVPEFWTRDEKLDWLRKQGSMATLKWDVIVPDGKHTWIAVRNSSQFDRLIPLGSKEARASNYPVAIFHLYSPGVKTNSDAYMYDFDRDRLTTRAQQMVEAFNSELDRWKRHGRPKDIEKFLDVDSRVLKWIRQTKRVLLRGEYLSFKDSNIRTGLYRPYCKQFYYFEPAFNEDVYRRPSFLPTPATEKENILICCTNHSQVPFAVQATNAIPEVANGGRAGQCFPLYTYKGGDPQKRKDNVTDWALARFKTLLNSATVTKKEIFHYVYGVLHHPSYRTSFADNLRGNLPRIPIPTDLKWFNDMVERGAALITLHTRFEELEPYPLVEHVAGSGERFSYAIKDKLRLSKDKSTIVVNPSLSLYGVPLEALSYKVGQRSALEWALVQYRVSDDSKSGIHKDANRADDSEYVLRVLGQVVRLSLDTLRITEDMPSLPSLGGGLG